MEEYRVRVSDCDAEACGHRCQEVCPQGVFLSVPRQKDRAAHGANPRYRIVARFHPFCDGCGECLAVCGQGAIRVSSRRTGENISSPART